ncbi:MAG TPA: hypothetical protein VLB69_07460 [Rudaea sp.]|nr:hypothetical protein [Rudaea sp.]
MFYWRWFGRPRHPLMRAFFAAIGAVLLVGVLVFGFFALVAFAFIGSIVAIVRAITRASAGADRAQAPAGASDPRVIEGEFVVLRNDAASLNR